MELPQNYNPKASEPKWESYWKEKKVFEFDSGKKGELFTIDTPPPTVSGNMHIGHAFSYSQQDFVARYKRMKGFNVYYPFGTDDNGLPTERLVEKLKGVKSTRMERPEFVELCRKTIKEIKPDFIFDWVRIGCSCDFSKPYSTIDAHCVRTSQKSFVDLYKKNLLYRRAAPSIWCVNCQTAIAQAELEDKDLPSSFSDVTFKIKNGDNITIATTRPELLPACVCVFVHPDDKRYRKLVGKNAIVPLFNQEVEIFADASADPEKGSGILMICSYGDRFDVDAINRKKLEPRICITKDGKMNDYAKHFAGLSIKDARKAILEELEAKGLLTAKKQISHVVNVHDKCGTEIEFLAAEQWFIKVMDNKEKFLEAGNKIKWHPETMKPRYDHWVENLNWDWCISRQRHFGVPFPVWYSKKDGSIIVADESQLPVDPLVDVPKGYKRGDVIAEKDVLDTWMTSSVSPQIILNWAEDKGYNLDFRKMYPMSLRPQAHDIIRTWAFYTIVKGIYHNNDVPWKEILISGNVSDPKGEKMSKSKGNVVYPRAVIDKYSADALRFWAAGSKLGEDLAYLEKDLVTGQKFVNKLWNASKFSLMHMEDYKHPKKHPKLESFDAWMMSKLQRIIKSATESFDGYEYSKSKHETDKFFWQVFCDNYLEICKDRLYNPGVRGKEGKYSAQYTLYLSLLSIIKLMAPITPHITEEIYQLYFSKIDGAISVHVSSWPEYDQSLVDDNSESMGDKLIDVIAKVRKYKSESQASLKEPIKVLTLDLDEDDVKPFLEDLKAATKAETVKFGKQFAVHF